MRIASPSIRPRGAKRWCLTLGALLLAGAVQAQTANGSESPVPTGVADLKFRSALETYRPYQEQAPESWREANDTVGRIGGWRAYAREISGPAAEKPAAGAGDPHAGHHGGKR